MGIGVANHLFLSFSGTLESGAYLEYPQLSFRASPMVLSMQPCKNISHIQVSLFTFLQPHP
jgi:hypothetical protein